MPLEVPPKHRPAMSRRIRRVWWTASSLAVLIAIGSLVAWRIRRDSEPAEYRPGEASADLTSTIGERAARNFLLRPNPHVPLSLPATPMRC